MHTTLHGTLTIQLFILYIRHKHTHLYSPTFAKGRKGKDIHVEESYSRDIEQASERERKKLEMRERGLKKKRIK